VSKLDSYLGFDLIGLQSPNRFSPALWFAEG